MARKTACRKLCLAMLTSLLAGSALAQGADQLPLAPDYVGEIRRSADGKLIAVPASEAAAGRRSGDGPAPATMVVGSGEKVTTLSEAARLARDGEVIEIRPGNYRGQPAIWTQNNLLIRAAGERPVMLADGKSAEGKAIWVVRGGKIRIENIEFRGARVPDGNGAGIRFEKGQLTIHGCRFVDNEMGVLTANSASQTLVVADSEFGDAPRHAGALHHLLYVGAIGKFTLSGSRFFNGYLGHLVKSRARENHVLYNMLADGAGGRASYELEFPNGGVAYVIGNVIAQSAETDNPSLLAYGAEGPRWPDNALYVAHNTLVNDKHAGNFLAVWAEKFPAGIDIWAINNLTVGNGNLFRPAQGRFEGNLAALRGELIEYGGLPLRLTNPSPLRGTVRLPGSVGGVNLLPSAEFTYPVGSRPIRLSNVLSPGAFQ
ncbi:hypothetical protein [Dechloromonas denitrificans]|uniref:hypothetical protein n=1 Tax=Dechloromonas denitrificans TaxID=281362 RepID=UPI001CFAD219|nr:hypothetical protein [Dechloromonas denitrificans]